MLETGKTGKPRLAELAKNVILHDPGPNNEMYSHCCCQGRVKLPREFTVQLLDMGESSSMVRFEIQPQREDGIQAALCEGLT